MERKKLHDLINELKHLHLREAELIKLIDEANAGQSFNSGATVDHEVFEEGDRVRVKNQVKKPANWGSDVWNHRQARLATVTFATTERDYFVTDNGVTT
jgi:hypothetical protein